MFGHLVAISLLGKIGFDNGMQELESKMYNLFNETNRELEICERAENVKPGHSRVFAKRTYQKT